MPETWDGKGETPPGWTKDAAEVIDDGAGSFSIDLESLATELDQPVAKARLTAAESTKLQAALSAKVELDAPVLEPFRDR
jgi:hypothetical protein